MHFPLRSRCATLRILLCTTRDATGETCPAEFPYIPRIAPVPTKAAEKRRPSPRRRSAPPIAVGGGRRAAAVGRGRRDGGGRGGGAEGEHCWGGREGKVSLRRLLKEWGLIRKKGSFCEWGGTKKCFGDLKLSQIYDLKDLRRDIGLVWSDLCFPFPLIGEVVTFFGRFISSCKGKIVWNCSAYGIYLKWFSHVLDGSGFVAIADIQWYKGLLDLVKKLREYRRCEFHATVREILYVE